MNLIRRAQPVDLEALLQLEALFPTDRMSRRSLRRLLSSPAAAVWVVPESAVDTGPIAADLVTLSRRNTGAVRIYSLVVDPAFRGRGLGTALIAHAEAVARRGGKRRMSLEVRADNGAARRLYLQLGYRVLATLPGYYGDGGDGLRLGRDLV